jgi:aminopeptidase N
VESVLVYGNQTPWYPQGPPDDYATAVVRTDAPEGYAGVTGGRLVSMRTVDGRTHAEYRLDHPGKYVTVAIGRLASVGAQEIPGIRVEAYAVPRLRRMAQERLSDAMAILRFYSAEFGPAPYPLLNLVFTESRVPGGHSPPGMVVVAVRPMLLKGSLRDDPASFPDIPDYFLAHELAHQWWGHGVSGQNYRERWISEGFAQYAAALWVRESRGEATFRSMLSRFAKWGLRYADEGPIHLGHRLGHIKNDPQIFRAVVYDKAAYVLHMLRQIVGDAPFRRALAQLQKERRFTKIGTEDVRRALEATTGRDLRHYFEAWVYGTRLPQLQMTHRSSPANGGWKTEVEVRGGEHLPGPVPLELAVAHAGGTEVRKVELGVAGGRWTVQTPTAPRKVEVNRDRGLLATVRAGPS